MENGWTDPGDGQLVSERPQSPLGTAERVGFARGSPTNLAQRVAQAFGVDAKARAHVRQCSFKDATMLHELGILFLARCRDIAYPGVCNNPERPGTLQLQGCESRVANALVAEPAPASVDDKAALLDDCPGDKRSVRIGQAG